MTVIRRSICSTLFAVVTFAIAMPVLAANWVPVAESIGGDEYFQDSESIRRNGNLVTVWEKIVFAKTKPNGEAYRLMRFRYDCSGETITTLNATLYTKEGHPLQTMSWSQYEQKNDAVIPDTVGETRFNAICNNI